MNILFVCLGNICRSPAAQAVFEQLLIDRDCESLAQADSAGTSAYHAGDPADPRMRAAARGFDVTIDHRSRQLVKQDLDRFDLILVMDQQNYEDVLRMARSEAHRSKVQLLRAYDSQGPGDVPDPYYGGARGFEDVLSMVFRCCEGLISDLLTSSRARDRVRSL